MDAFYIRFPLIDDVSIYVCVWAPPAASPDLSCPIPGAGSGSLTSLGLKELLELHRQRLEQSKQHFLLSTPPTPTSCGSISLCHSPTPSSLTVGETSNEAEQDRERDQDQPEEEPEEENTEQDSALQLTTSTSNVIGNLQKSPSANSSLHLLYTNLFRKLGQGKRRRKRGISSGGLSPSEDEDDVDGGVCDISGGDLSDDYDHCDVALRRRSLRSRQPRDVSETDYHGDAEAEAEGETVPRESCYETSDTGGELTNTDDLDSSLNLISNLSYNSSNNSNACNVPGGATAPDARNTATTSTTAPGKSGHALSVQGGRQQPKTGALAQIKPKPKPILMPKHKAQGKGGSLSSPLSNSNSSDCSSASPSAPATLLQLSPVGRSKSFQESAAITAVSRYKKYGRGLFQRRRSKRSPKNAVGVGGKSNYSLDRLSQNIEITIQDEDGNFHPYDDNYHMLAGRLDATDVDDDVGFDDLYLDDRPSGASDDVAFAGDISDGGASSRSRASDASDGHVLGRLLRQVRQGLSVGWRKPRYQKRRGD